MKVAPLAMPAVRNPRRAPEVLAAAGAKPAEAAPKVAAASPVQLARVSADQVLAAVSTKARAISAQPRSISTDARFIVRLKELLADYLANPTPAAGKAAAAKIGEPFKGPPSPGDFWEESALRSWNKQPIPAAVRSIRRDLPETLEAATDMLSAASRAKLPYIDSPHLLGGGNTDVGADADVKGGGKNISQLMHWATGVKYSDVGEKSMRDLFLGYEMWHLEGWDVFAEDPINDLISEEQGRLFGVKLRKGEVSSANLLSTVDTTFEEARAWVGSLLNQRKTKLDGWVRAEKQAPANMWWGHLDPWNVWGEKSLLQLSNEGQPLAEVMNGGLAGRMSGVYSLVYDAQKYEAKHGKFKHSTFTRSLLEGKLDKILGLIAREETIPWQVKARAGWDAGIISTLV